MSAWITIIVHYLLCVENQNPLLDDSQAESQSHMCISYKSDQHRPSESSYGHNPLRPLFLKSHENSSPHESPKQQNRALLVMTRLCLRYFESTLSFCSQSLPQTGLTAALLIQDQLSMQDLAGAASETFFC